MRLRRIRSSLVVLAVLGGLSAEAALGHGDEPIKVNPNILSRVKSIEPPAPGVSARVVGRGDALEVTNTGAAELIVIGYFGERFLRLRPDGVVEENRISPTHSYLEDPNAPLKVKPAEALKRAPVWKPAGRGSYTWPDQRVIYTGKLKPPQVIDELERSKVSDWRVPILVGERRGAIRGTMIWDPRPPKGTKGGEDSSRTPVVAIAGAAALLLAGASLLVRRRRGRDYS